MDAMSNCLCPLVWNGHGNPKPDPKRIDPECPIHGSVGGVLRYEFAVVGQDDRVVVHFNGTVEAGWRFIHERYEVDRLDPRGPSVTSL